VRETRPLAATKGEARLVILSPRPFRPRTRARPPVLPALDDLRSALAEGAECAAFEALVDLRHLGRLAERRAAELRIRSLPEPPGESAERSPELEGGASTRARRSATVGPTPNSCLARSSGAHSRGGTRTLLSLSSSRRGPLATDADRERRDAKARREQDGLKGGPFVPSSGNFASLRLSCEDRRWGVTRPRLPRPLPCPATEIEFEFSNCSFSSSVELLQRVRVSSCLRLLLRLCRRESSLLGDVGTFSRRPGRVDLFLFFEGDHETV